MLLVDTGVPTGDQANGFLVASATASLAKEVQGLSTLSDMSGKSPSRHQLHVVSGMRMK